MKQKYMAEHFDNPNHATQMIERLGRGGYFLQKLHNTGNGGLIVVMNKMIEEEPTNEQETEES